MRAPFDHLLALSDATGTFTNAVLVTPDRDAGYTTDIAAQALTVVYGEPERPSPLDELEQNNLRFVIDAQDHLGRTRNHRSRNGRWTGTPTTGVAWGRSVWALGTAAVHASEPQLQRFAYDLCCEQQFHTPIAAAYAALGADQVHTLPQTSPRWNTPAQHFAHWFDDPIEHAATNQPATRGW